MSPLKDQNTSLRKPCIGVSVIVPVYNVQNYIVDCLESVCGQTYEGPIECILVDDCGQDCSIKIAEEYIASYKGNIVFKIIHHSLNKGLSCARNTGIINAVGEYLFFLDSDDTITPDCLKLLADIANRYVGVDVVQSSIKVDNESWHSLSDDCKREYSDNKEWIRAKLCTFAIPDPAWNKLVRTKFIRDNNLFFVEGLIQEDTLWSYTIQKAIHSIAFCYEDTYIYRNNPEGIMKTNTGLKEAASFAKICNVVSDDLKLCKDIKPYEIQFLEINALRIRNTGGVEALKMMNFFTNPFFRLLLNLKLISFNEKKWMVHYLEKFRNGIVKLLRLCLCNRYVFFMS